MTVDFCPVAANNAHLEVINLVAVLLPNEAA